MRYGHMVRLTILGLVFRVGFSKVASFRRQGSKRSIGWQPPGLCIVPECTAVSENR